MYASINQSINQSINLYVLLPCHMMDVGQVCTSALHIISKRQSSRHKFMAPGQRFVHKKAHQRPSYLDKIGIKI